VPPIPIETFLQPVESERFPDQYSASPIQTQTQWSEPMKIAWSGRVDVAPPPEVVYAYLVEFSRHREWVDSLESITETAPGDANGIGRKYLAIERVDFSGSGGLFAKFAKRTSGRTESEIRELIPDKRISWYAHPIPNVGGALLTFDFAPNNSGGTTVVQTINERYPWHISLLMRVITNFSEQGAIRQFEQGLARLKIALDTLPTQGQ
jgi:uncharacterized membrane protein